MYIGSAVTSTPSSRTRPESGAVSPTTIENVVVLPAPLAPRRPITSPEAISTLTPLTTVLPLYDLVRSFVTSVDIQRVPGLEPQGTLELLWGTALEPLTSRLFPVRWNFAVVPSLNLQSGGVSSKIFTGLPVIV